MNNKPVYIINGSAGVGKDTFVSLCNELVPVLNHSSIDKVKEIAREIGWNGIKDEKSRKFLSDLKLLTTMFNDMPFKDLVSTVDSFKQKDLQNKALFLHIREPEEIERAKVAFGAKTVLVMRDSIKQVTSNMADANVYNYAYDFTIYNNGTLDDLRKEAKGFLISQEVL